MNKKKVSIIISIVIVALAIGIGTYRFSSKNKLDEDNKVLSENSEIEDSDKDDDEVKQESTDQSKDYSKDEDLAKEEDQKKAEEDDKKTEEEKKVQEQQLTQQTTQPTNNTNTNTGSSNNSSGGEAQQAVTPPTPVKKDSYWNDSLAQQAVEIFESYNASTNNYTTDNRSYDQATYNSYYSIAESFKNGNISSDTAKSKINNVVFEMVGMKFHHTDTSVGKIEVSSTAIAKDITNSVAMKGGSSNFMYIKVYYNGDKDKNIIYYVSSGSALPI